MNEKRKLLDKLRLEFAEIRTRNSVLNSIIKKINSGNADFSDTFRYADISSELLGEFLSEKVSELSHEDREYICAELLKAQHQDINRKTAKVQKSLDEKQGINLSPQKASFPVVRANQIAHSLADPTVPIETIIRRADGPVANVAKSFHDDYIKENAKFRSDAGLKCFIVRTTDGNCCKWCSSIAGRYEYDDLPDDIFRRHDNCGCSTIYENGRQRQDVWSKKSWEVPAVTQKKSAPTKLSNEQAKELQVRNLSYRGLESESSKLKTDNPNTIVNLQNINSSSYRRLFERIDNNPHTSRTIFQNARNILTHRNGTEYEDLVFINSLTGEVRSRTDFNVPKNVKPSKSMQKMLKDNEPNTIIAIHNHPNSTVPSISDINAARDRKYKYGIIACHNGNIYKYTVLKEYDESFVDLALDSINSVLYNKDKLGDKFKEQFENSLKLLRVYGINMEVLP